MALRFTIIDQSGNSTVIDEPIGWDAINLHYIRHKEWHGFIDTIDDTMGSLQFYGSGYQILSAAFATYGVEAQCGFLVEYQCSGDDTTWDTIYQGQFSFYQYKEVQGLNGCHVECSVESVTNVMTLKSRYEQKVDLNSLIPFQTPQNPLANALNQIQAISISLLNRPDPSQVDINTGDTYLVPAAVGTWQANTGGQIATWTDAGSWTYTHPQAGQVLVDMSSHQAIAYLNSAPTYPTGYVVPTFSPALPSGWYADPDTLPAYPALGSEILMPSKTIQLTTGAIVNTGPYFQPNSATPVTAGGSSFWINNNGQYSSNAQSVQSMQLSWIGGVISQEVPSFTGADANWWNGRDAHDANPDPIFTYAPDSDFTSPNVTININISGTITSDNDSTNPAQITLMRAALCYGKDYGTAFNNMYGSNYPPAITLGGTYDSTNSCYNAFGGANGTVIGFSYNSTPLTVPMPTGTNVYLVFEVNFKGRGGNTQFCTVNFTGSASFTIDTSYPDTAAPVYMINESLSRVSEAITDGQIRVYSDFFGRTDSLPYDTKASDQPGIGDSKDGEGSLLCITNGLLIRGYTQLDGSQPPMPVSLKQLFEALNAVYNIGMTIEPDQARTGMNWLRIEPMEYFYPLATITGADGNPLICDNVDEITVENQADKYVGIFRTGYSKWQGEQTGGLDDFMNRREYRTALSTTKNVLEKYCGFIGSSYAIETTRRQTGINTQDWRFDHENFLICLDRPATLVQATAGSTIDMQLVTTNVFHPEPNLTYPNFLTTYIHTITGVQITPNGSGYDPNPLNKPTISIYSTTGNHLLAVGRCDVNSLGQVTGVSGSFSYYNNGYAPTSSSNHFIFQGTPTVNNGITSTATYYVNGTAYTDNYHPTVLTTGTLAGYAVISAPTVAPAPTAATGTVVLSGDSVLFVIVTNGGSGYSIPPLVQIAAPTNPPVASGGVQATAIATLVNGVVSSVQIVNQGSGYSGSSPLVQFNLPNAQPFFVEQKAVTPADAANNTIVDSDSLYNYRISPLRNAMRWVRSIFQSYSDWMGGVLHFVSGEANIIASGKYNGIAGIVPVIENAQMAENSDISYAHFANPADYAPLYSNQTVKFTYPLSYADWVALSAQPYGLIGYSVNGGSTLYGWIEELKYSPFEGTAEFTLRKQI